MTLLPVVDRELRVASRRPSTYWARSVAAAVALSIAVWWYWVNVSGHRSLNALGGELFWMLAGFTMGYAIFAGITYSSDSVSQEKREGTLGLLFLTDLRGYDVVLGKLTASSVGAFYRLLAVLPVLAITLMMGGVAFSQFWRMVLVLVNTLFASLALGMLASAVSINSRRAALTAGQLIALLCVGFPFAGLMISVFSTHPFPSICGWATPLGGFSLASDTLYRTVPQGTWFRKFHLDNKGLFWLNLAATHAIAWSALGVASLWLPRSWQQYQTVRGGGLRLPGRSAREAERNTRRELLDRNPIIWLASREPWKRPLLWMALLGGACLFLFFGWRFGSSFWDSGTYLVTSILVHFILKAWVASEAPRLFARDRRSGAMELYLSTDLTVAQVLHGQIAALLRHFGAALGIVLLTDVLFLLKFDVIRSGEGGLWLLFWIIRMGFLALDFFTLCWVGMWLGMVGQGPRDGSAGGVLFRVIFLPWLLAIGGGAFLMATQMAIGAFLGDNSGFTVLLLAWATIGIGIDVAWMLYCRRVLSTQFRNLATIVPGAKRSSWWHRFVGR